MASWLALYMEAQTLNIVFTGWHSGVVKPHTIIDTMGIGKGILILKTKFNSNSNRKEFASHHGQKNNGRQ